MSEETKRGRGRPRIRPVDDVRRNVTLALSADIYDEIKANAEAAGRSLSREMEIELARAFPDTDGKRRRGRPRKSPEEVSRRPNFSLRVRQEIYDSLTAIARQNGRSLSEEVERRLEDSLGPSEAMKIAIRKVLAERPQVESRTLITLSPSGLQALGGPVLRHLRHINAVSPANGVGRVAFEY